METMTDTALAVCVMTADQARLLTEGSVINGLKAEIAPALFEEAS